MSSNSSQDYQSSETLDGILKDAGMKNFENAKQQAMRMRAAGVLIGNFQNVNSDVVTDNLAAVDTGEKDIAGAVEVALALSSEIDSEYIFVSAAGSEITLAGWAPSEQEIFDSSIIAAHVAGVKAVRNELSKSL